MSRSIPRAALAGAVLLLGAGSLSARAAAPPSTIVPPKGLNLGSTSFYDGFGRLTEGWSLLEYGRYEDLSSINDYQGHASTSFKGTHIQVFVALTQFNYTTNWHPFGGDAVAFSAAIPVVDLNSHFAANSPVKLNNNGFGQGDLVWGPIYQSKTYMADGRPVFSWRTQLIIQSPTGAVDADKSINQGAGYWAINPYVTFTWLPLPRFEFSNRFNYQYNFQSANFSNPPPIPHLIYRNGQAGQIVYDNFAASYAFTPTAYLGINGYALSQLNPDKINGIVVPHSLQNELYLGPGGRYLFTVADSLNVNLYLPVISRNATSGPQVNFQYIHRF